MRDGKQQLDECLQGVVQRIIPIETKDTEVDVVATEDGLEHGEADGNTLQFQCINLVLRYLAQSQDSVPCRKTPQLHLYTGI